VGGRVGFEPVVLEFPKFSVGKWFHEEKSLKNGREKKE